LKAPVYFIFAFRKKDLDITSPYEFHIIRSKTELGGKRSEQKQQMANLAVEYASHLEKFCLEHPYQWYNFYDFWQKGEKK
jgi:predicted LPLAT superfamily acyltransferase